MQLYDWLHLLHVVSGFLVVVGLIALWTLVFGTRPGSALFDARSATTFGRVGGILVGVGMMGALVFGIWLAIDSDRYQLWDGWILGSLVLWAFGGWAGGRAGREFERDPVAGRPAGIRLQALNSFAVLAILVLMLWKPGA
jgi:hypothetical protein